MAHTTLTSTEAKVPPDPYLPILIVEAVLPNGTERRCCVDFDAWRAKWCSRLAIHPLAIGVAASLIASRIFFLMTHHV
jgi:hypothetical protein